MSALESLLRFPSVYSWFGKIAGRDSRGRYVREYIRPQTGQRVLDIGCGPGDVLAHLPAVDYLGIDISPEYIDRCRERYGARGRFRCEDLMQTELDCPGTYDLVTATGLLHHLTDEQAGRLLSIASQAQRPGGRLVTLDGCWVPEQSRLARLFLSLDRGKHIRTPKQYRALTEDHFLGVQTHVVHDLLRIPYTLFVMECTRPAVSQSQSA